MGRIKTRVGLEDYFNYLLDDESYHDADETLSEKSTDSAQHSASTHAEKVSVESPLPEKRLDKKALSEPLSEKPLLDNHVTSKPAVDEMPAPPVAADSVVVSQAHIESKPELAPSESMSLSETIAVLEEEKKTRLQAMLNQGVLTAAPSVAPSVTKVEAKVSVAAPVKTVAPVKTEEKAALEVKHQVQQKVQAPAPVDEKVQIKAEVNVPVPVKEETLAPPALKVETVIQQTAPAASLTGVLGLLKWNENGRPAWANNEFDALFFTVAGLTLAVPLVALGQIFPIQNKKMVPLAGQSQWFMGMFTTPFGDLRAVDTAMLVMPERYNENYSEKAKYIISIDGMPWGLAVDEVKQPVRLQVDDVKWRSERSKRAWLAGTVKSKMCALLDLPQIAHLLEKSDKNSKHL